MIIGKMRREGVPPPWSLVRSAIHRSPHQEATRGNAFWRNRLCWPDNQFRLPGWYEGPAHQ